MEDIFKESDREQILSSIREAEKRTSGEIRVHIEKKCNSDAMTRAIEVFGALGMQNTKLKNGVLFYLALENHEFAVIGDSGINDVVPVGFWQKVRDILQDNFKHQKFTEGLVQGVKLAGEQLSDHFPHAGHEDKDELSNEISFGK